MNILTADVFDALLGVAPMKPRYKRDLKFGVSIADMSPNDWAETELLAIRDRSGNRGVLLLAVEDTFYMTPYELSTLSPSSSTGRSSAIICDFCMTWQAGTRAGSILFPNVHNDRASTGFICCFDLLCSRHVRTKTSAAKISRAQLREHMDNDGRVARLQQRITSLVETLGLTPLAIDK